jgi:hypothetical protein
VLLVVVFLAVSFAGGTGGCGGSGEAASDGGQPDTFEDGGIADDTGQGDAPVALEIVSTAPSSGELDVSLLTEISVTFNRPLSDLEIASAVLTVSGDGAPVEGALSFEDGGTTIVFTPSAMLTRGVTYTAGLSLEIASASQEAVGDGLSWAFTTDPAYYVGPSGDDSGDGLREFPWKSIQYAIDMVTSGSTIRFLAGAYSEPATVVVGKSLTLAGEGRDLTVIGPPAVVGAGFVDQAIMDVAGADDNDPDNISVTIENLTIDAEETPGLKFGVLLRGGAYAVVRNCTLKGAMEAQGSVNSGNIAVGWNDFGYKARALIENNLVTDFHSFGIAVYGIGNEAVIRNNDIVGNTAMHICSSNPGVWAGAMGIVIQSNKSATVEGNTIMGLRHNPSCNPAAYDAAIETYWPGDMVITGNIIEDNDYGFASYAAYGSAATLTLDGNDMLNNDIGIQLGNINIVSVRENNIEGNATFGVRNSMAAAVDVSENYWGAVDGPNPPGSGDAISGNLVTAPFSTVHW